MKPFEITRIGLEDWPKCGAIWNMETFPYTEQFREQIRAGNREVFVLTVDGTYIAECDLVKDNPEYGTVPGRRLYLSRLIVRRDCRVNLISKFPFRRERPSLCSCYMA